MAIIKSETARTADSIPVGAVLTYAAEPGSLPSNWVVCEGQSYAVRDYPDLFGSIGYSNGGGGDVFKVPDLRGRFLRGSNKANLVPGATHGWKTANARNPFKVKFDQMANSSWYTLKIAGPAYVAFEEGSTRFNASGGDSETRPVNTYLYYIIKIQKSTLFMPTNDIVESISDMPLGAVFPFGGADKAYPPDFPACIRCDGSSVKVGKAADLSKLVGTRFTADKNPTHYVAPNLAGKFIRGVDPQARNDPDARSRELAPDGSTQGLGTWQKCATAFTNPHVDIPHFGAKSRSSAHVLGNRCIQDSNHTSNQAWSGGDKETRPKNAALHFYVNSIDPSKLNQTFPIGAIIAIPGVKSNLDEAVWLPCDGSKYNRRLYSELFAVIGTTWGFPADAEQWFFVPDLRSYYLRGADVQGVENGDPDWKSRHGNKNGSVTGAGSYQDWATAAPVKAFKLNVKYPNNPQDSSKATDLWTNVSAAGSGSQSYTLKFDASDETAPTSVVARFYIKALP